MKNIVFQEKTKEGLDLLIRYPAVGDLEDMHKYANSLSAEKTFISNQGISISFRQEKEYLNRQLKKISDGRSIQLVAYNGRQLVGICGVDLKDRASKHVGTFGISIAKDFRSKKIGSKLMEVVLSEAKKSLQNLKVVVLTVFANNTVAYEMYRKFGFKEYGRLPKGVSHREKFVDEIYMYKNM